MCRSTRHRPGPRLLPGACLHGLPAASIRSERRSLPAADRITARFIPLFATTDSAARKLRGATTQCDGHPARRNSELFTSRARTRPDIAAQHSGTQEWSLPHSGIRVLSTLPLDFSL